MSGSAMASPAALATAQSTSTDVVGASSPVSPEPGGAGSLRWQRARLVLDQHQRGADVGPVGQVLPVHAGLAHLLPHRGLRRGSTVVVRGSTTVLLALLAQATAEGSWAAVVGMPDLGLLAAAELGVAVSRLALVPHPGAEFGAVVGALLDGLDVVAVAATRTLTTEKDNPTRTKQLTALARRLSARARHRESVLVSFGSWPGADLELTCTESGWSGLGQGHGHLTERELTITVQGRGAASRPTSTQVLLPAAPEPRAHFTPTTAPATTAPPRSRLATPRSTGAPAPLRRPAATPPTGTGAPGPLRWLPDNADPITRPADHPPTHLSAVPDPEPTPLQALPAMEAV